MPMTTEITEVKDGIDLDVLTRVMSDFKQLPPDERQILLQLVATNFKISVPNTRQSVSVHEALTEESGQISSPGRFSEDRSMSPKDFIMEKQPRTDVEKVACLAYYLTHYKNTPHFRTLDISKMNTDAAQPKFSNAAMAVDNATKSGYLVPATKGNKQLSARGEQFVQALPDRDAAKEVMSNTRIRRRTRKQLPKKAPKVASRRNE
jgi:hypothetical protein